jgi:outer membrane protein OmpA-like peptidoglycan-associated protein
MSINIKSIGAILAIMSMVSVTVHAESRGTVPGYLTDSKGNIAVSKSGNCVHTGSWKPEYATIAGCDGYVVDIDVEVIVGAPTGIVANIVLPAGALFEFDKAEITEEAATNLEERLIEFREDWRPELAQAFAAIIIGHTDSIGRENYNLELSLKRAEAVGEFLVANGVPAQKLRVLGRGAGDPIASNDTDAGRAENRRVEIFVIAEPRALDVIRFPSAGIFPRRSAGLTPQGRQVLNENLIEAIVMLKRSTVIEIVGHTDDVGEADYNQELSEDRALTVGEILVLQGVNPSKIIARGAGETMPIASNATKTGRADNRRVEINVLGRLR